MSTLEFEVYSGGTISINLDECSLCSTKVCLEVCETQGGPLVLDDETGVPTLRWIAEEVTRGGCSECLGCELDCRVHGRSAITITMPLRGFDKYLRSLAEPLVYHERGPIHEHSH